MEPRSFDRGDIESDSKLGWSDSTLQWSRGLLTAETIAVRSKPDRSAHASMEPRSFDRGDPESNCSDEENSKCFNGAAVF